MTKRCLRGMFLLTLFSSFLAPCPAGTTSDSPDTKWLEHMEEGWSLLKEGSCAQAVSSFDRALNSAPSSLHKADAIMYIAKSYEAGFERWSAISSYKRIVEEFVQSPHLTEACFQLGELHRSTSALPDDASEDNVEKARLEMRNANAIPYFESAVGAGAPVDRYVLSSKMYLSVLYMETGREAEAWDILREMVSIDVYEVTRPDYIGPFREAHPESIATPLERIDAARQRANLTRSAAMRKMVDWSVTPGDPEASIAGLNALIADYPETPIETMARAKLQEVMDLIIQTGAVAVPNDLEEFPDSDPSTPE